MALITGTPGNDALTGTGDADMIEGLAGDDTLIGGAGRDTILGGDGDDRIDPGDNSVGGTDYVDTGFGNDTVNLSGQTPAQSYFQLGHSSLNGTGNDIRVLIDADNNLGVIDKGAAGTTWLVDVVAALANGPDWGGMGISGTEYDDEFHVDPGEGGWIEVAPGAGSDLIRIGDGDGFVRLGYWDAAGGVVANLGLGTMFKPGATGGVDFDTILGRVNEFHASHQNDRIIGSRLDDIFIPGQGDDFLNGKAGFDTVRYDRSGVTAVKVDLGAGIATGTWGGRGFTDTLKNIEAVRGSRDHGDRLKGDGGANHLDGRGGNDTLHGRSGDDTLIGGAGKDRLFGGNGHDDLQGGAGKDLLYGSSSFDIMTGGSQADRFIFSTGHQALITDFDAANGKDRIDLRGVAEITSYADLTADHLRVVMSAGAGEIVEIHDSAGTSITLGNGVTIADLSAADFII
jgi:Ca2+-binding RTX toxin-like protein